LIIDTGQGLKTALPFIQCLIPQIRSRNGISCALVELYNKPLAPPSAMSGKQLDDGAPPGEPAPEILEGRIWVDGCWDFFHHGSLIAPLDISRL
jgi:hypothetical protein